MAFFPDFAFFDFSQSCFTLFCWVSYLFAYAWHCNIIIIVGSGRDFYLIGYFGSLSLSLESGVEFLWADWLIKVAQTKAAKRKKNRTLTSLGNVEDCVGRVATFRAFF